jgi:hypothetical protein
MPVRIEQATAVEAAAAGRDSELVRALSVASTRAAPRRQHSNPSGTERKVATHDSRHDS